MHRYDEPMDPYDVPLYWCNISLNRYNEPMPRGNETMPRGNEVTYGCNGPMYRYDETLIRDHGNAPADDGPFFAYDEASSSSLDQEPGASGFSPGSFSVRFRKAAARALTPEKANRSPRRFSWSTLWGFSNVRIVFTVCSVMS